MRYRSRSPSAGWGAPAGLGHGFPRAPPPGAPPHWALRDKGPAVGTRDRGSERSAGFDCAALSSVRPWPPIPGPRPPMNDLRYALRTLARSPGLTLAAVLTLGLGIGANTAMFGVVDRLFFRPPAHVVDPDRVVRVNVTWQERLFGNLTGWLQTYPRYEDLDPKSTRLNS